MTVAKRKIKPAASSSIEDILAEYQKEQEKLLGLEQEDKQHWFDSVPRQFLAKEKAVTTILFGRADDGPGLFD
ncbi:hypothetical protein [Paenibacillus sp. TH7-28]